MLASLARYTAQSFVPTARNSEPFDIYRFAVFDMCRSAARDIRAQSARERFAAARHELRFAHELQLRCMNCRCAA